MTNPLPDTTKLTYWLLLSALLLFASAAEGQDTIRVPFDQILVLPDTTYFGVNDSVVITDEAVDYELLKNFLIRKPAYYERKPHKIESAKRLNQRYGAILMGQIYDKQQELPEDFNPADNYYSIYNGRVVKEIRVERVPVLDGNVFDTTNVELSTVGRFLNSTYSPTQEFVIRNNLKFKENDRLKPRIFSDNERLLRRLDYIEDAKIQVVPVENSMDSVVVLVVVKDRYPIGVRGRINDVNAFQLEPYSRNFLGRGHYLGAILEYDGNTDDKFGYGAYYGIDNIGGSFVNGELQFNRGLDKRQFRIDLKKPFATTYTRVGGEVIYERLREKVVDRKFVIDSLYAPDQKYSRNLLDVWAGYSHLFPTGYEHPFLNIAGRMYSEHFTDRPREQNQYNFLFYNTVLTLASISYQQVSYIKTSKLVQYGTIEDVPTGVHASLTGGWQHTADVNRPYLGTRINYAVYFQNAGIFMSSIDMGAFRYRSALEDAVTVLRLAYASPLGELGSFELRNLLQVNYNAVHKPRYLIPVLYADYLMADKGLDGFNGNQNFVLNYRPVFYLKYTLAGFRFSVDPFVDQGWVKRAVYESNRWDSYTILGINFSTKNESLIFSTLHVQFAYYLNDLPDQSRFRFKLVFKDLKLFRNFTELKPRIAEVAQ